MTFIKCNKNLHMINFYDLNDSASIYNCPSTGNKLPLPVSEWSDDQPVCTPYRLIHVGEVHVGDGDDAGVCVLVEVEAGLLQPLKVIHGLDVHAHLVEGNDNNHQNTISQGVVIYINI